MTAQTEALHELRDKVSPEFRDEFCGTTDEHVSAEPTSRAQQQWLRTWDPMICKSVKDAERLRKRGIESVQNFLRMTCRRTPRRQ